MRQRVMTAAEVVVDALGRHGLQLRTYDDQDAGLAAVTDGMVLMVRPPRAPRLSGAAV
ncbi:hypothetical protein [Micromonospora sp. KC606]|uniref:hypothetical protein n=1 Tax=Micromonospora sp. KC606 TaxID=2530379 RepID=UPI001404EB07|nr:hypothetical protein [Micromonospora sp. KC606]